MKIALVSEHASPLAGLGGEDAGGQNVHVAALADHLVRRGHDVTVYTRRDRPGAPARLRVAAGYLVEHVPAGPAEPILKDHLLPYMAAFGECLARARETWTPDIVHTHFWMSGPRRRSARLRPRRSARGSGAARPLRPGRRRAGSVPVCLAPHRHSHRGRLRPVGPRDRLEVSR